MAKDRKKKWLDELTRQIQEGVGQGYHLGLEMREQLGDVLNRLLPRRKAPAVWQYKHRVAQTAPQLLSTIGSDNREGWELVSVTHDGVNLIAFLKRAKVEEGESREAARNP